MISEVFFGRCSSCGGETPVNYPLCQSCVTSLEKYEAFCGKCGFPVSKAGACCYRCRSKFFNKFTDIYAVYKYKGALRNLLLGIKFHYNIRGALTLKNITELPDFNIKYDCVVSVPSFALRRFRRFRHPADILADIISERLDIPNLKLLKRIRNTSFQSLLLKKERFENVKNAFHCGKLPDNVKNILLADDILTTGATVSECASSLKKAGAKRIDCIVFAK